MAENGANVAAALSPEDELAALLLAKGKSNRFTATKVGCSEVTIRRRLMDPEFAARVSELQDAEIARAKRTIKSGAVLAAQTIRQAGAMKVNPSATQLAAAKTTLAAVGIDVVGQPDPKPPPPDEPELDDATVRAWLASRGLPYPGDELDEYDAETASPANARE